MSLASYYEDVLTLLSIEALNETRKSLIKLAVFKIVALSTPEKVSPGPEDPLIPATGQGITEKNQEYELAISKLKQQYFTKGKIQESKVENLQQEVERLQKQVKTLRKDSHRTVSRTEVPLVSTFSPSLRFTSRHSFSPDSNSILSPLRLAKSRPPPGFRKTSEIKSRAGEAFMPDASDFLHLLKTKSPAADTPRRSPSRNTFVRTFDDPPTPSKGGKPVVGDTSVNEAPEANSTALGEVSDDTFASANSSMSSVVLKEPRRKIKILKSKALKSVLKSRGGLHLEDEDTPLNYYQDENFEVDANSPERKRKRKAESDGSEPVTAPAPKRKKNVFSIL